MNVRVPIVLLAFATSAGAFQLTLDPRAIQQALAIGQTRLDRDRARFNAPYRIEVAQPPLDYVDVITPFRRVVLEAAARASVGDRSFGQRQALELLAASSGALELQLELSFHPLNTYVGVPEYTVTLTGAGSTRIRPRTLTSTPRYGPRVDGVPLAVPTPGVLLPGQSQPILGATIIALFDGRLLNPNGLYQVVIADASQERARVPLDLARLR